MAVPNSDRIDRLRAAIESIAAGDSSDPLGRAKEEAKAPIKARALRLLDQRARSTSELTDRLRRALPDTPEELIDEVVADLERANLLDDAYFAREWVRQRHQRRGKSRAALNQELVRKGVATRHREEALAQITADDEESRARDIVEKKARALKVPPADRHEYDKELRRLLGMLARRGFPGGMSMPVARQALDERIAQLRADSAGI
ncbi:regulatory protein RecX [Corynebacterium ulceribovis]|uniref:regulatory protein RecX n=1 Tax=Corynebacterium ulceribovis TaxID=487732 RepID=UPI00035C2134|nr:regulatory protein RecX [Corynebacterium ulceribovis]